MACLTLHPEVLNTFSPSILICHHVSMEMEQREQRRKDMCRRKVKERKQGDERAEETRRQERRRGRRQYFTSTVTMTTAVTRPEQEVESAVTSCLPKYRQQTAMDDTYAVVNKHKQPPASDPASSAVATPTSSRTLPPSHHYDNDPSRASAPVYSVVRPRGKPHSLPLSATPLYDVPPLANHRPGDSGEYHLSPAGGLSPTDDDYEDFCSSAPDAAGLGSPGGIGFNCRIQKPRGPRDPPADWSRLER